MKVCLKNPWMPFLAAGLLAQAQGQDLAVRSYVDRNVIAVGQQFTLSIEVSGKNANNASDPQLPNMEAFAGYVGSGSSQSINFVNGKMSASRTIHTYHMAMAAGKFQIGPVQVTSEGKKYETAPIPIEIVQGGGTPPAQSKASPQQGTGPAEGDVFIRAVAAKKQVFQNEPVAVSYRLFTTRNITSIGNIKMPGTAGFWTEDFAISQEPVPTTEVVEGRRYTVFLIKRMALFPMGTGTKTIEPLVMDCDVQMPRRRSNDPFSDFFDDPFLSNRAERKHLQSNSVVVLVSPLPEEGKPAGFSGLVGQFSIHGRADKTSLRTNEAVSLKITVQGQGNLRSFKEPSVVLPSDFETYPPKTTEAIERSGGAITGSKTFEYVMIPRVAGPQTIKPVRLSYFDPSDRKYKTVQTAEWSFAVAQGQGAAASVPIGLSKEEVKLLGQDIRFIKTSNPEFRKIDSAFTGAAWFWAVLISPLLVLGAGMMVRKHQDRLAGDVAYARGRRASRAVRRRFDQARGASVKPGSSKAFYAEVAKAMMGFLGDKLNIAEAGMISSDIRTRLGGKGIRDEIAAEYFDCLGVCDRMRFSPSDAGESEMKHFLDRAEKAVTQMERALG
jgi:hypothetical protein